MDTSKRILLALVILAVAGCSKKEVIPEHPVEVQFQLLNATGEPTTSFREGEDIVFEYRMVNRSSEDIVWYDQNEMDKPVYPVFNVYKDISGDLTLVGPTHAPYIFDFKWGNTLLSTSPAVIRVTWLGNAEETKITWGSIKYLDNSSLPKGKYVVKFEHAIQFAKFDQLYAHFNVPFEIH
ncbi:hypothetical protein JHJ32_09185 [Parapedobacter sp. ISTM3]|uniref:hypothetical protein n=1 Tax=Parapedobacter sp. ISTM3 TaxID=2800130 RepID=UPI00190323F6|nr:hypothetical protein [Parapedobacter sp. ISTM3]MBK1440157.1 hypothetical protein [Parapedobacter sp. ISTM3]